MITRKKFKAANGHSTSGSLIEEQRRAPVVSDDDFAIFGVLRPGSLAGRITAGLGGTDGFDVALNPARARAFSSLS